MLLKNLLACASLLAIVGCTTAGTPFRLVINNNPCGEDDKETLKAKLSDADQTDFFNVIAPIADLDRAVQTVGKDDPKIKKPDVQKKIGTDILEACFLTETPLEKDFTYQTYKHQKSVKGGKAPNKQCPIALEQVVTVDQTPPTAVDPKADPKVEKSVKSNIAFRWLKADANYKLLGPIQSLDFSGSAETKWLKEVSKKANIQVKVDETYSLKSALDGNRQITGHQNICKMFQHEKEERTKRDLRYEATVVRIGLKFEKFKAEGKFITVVKQILDDKQNWVTDRSLRSDFFINGVLLTDAEIAGLEAKRQKAIGLVNKQ